MNEMIVGRNPVLEALRAGRRVHRLILASGARGRSVEQLVQLAKEQNVKIQYLPKQAVDDLVPGSNHQGVVAEVAPFEYVDLFELLGQIEARGEDPFLVILDEIEDPHNLGAIIRSVDAAGAHGVIIPERRSAGVTATVAKTSAGAIEYVPVCQVKNLARAMEELKKHGIWIAGADMSGEQLHTQASLTGPLALVIGSEGRGLRRLVREKCDFLVKLPMYGKVNSLNASVAAGILLYEVVRQRRQL